MNDRYLFRAKRIDNGEWIVGSLIQAPYLGSMRSWISSEQEDKARLREISSNQAVWRAFEVRNDTICQCTGLKDKNGKLIWENDIMKYQLDGKTRIYVVKYEPPMFSYKNVIRWSLYQDEVIGNIFDNPELLESEE